MGSRSTATLCSFQGCRASSLGRAVYAMPSKVVAWLVQIIRQFLEQRSRPYRQGIQMQSQRAVGDREHWNKRINR